jgi:hypothetical protein
MIGLFKGEGGVELLFAAMAISVFRGWLVTVRHSRLSAPAFREAWPSQRQPAIVERGASTPPGPAKIDTSRALAAR